MVCPGFWHACPHHTLQMIFAVLRSVRSQRMSCSDTQQCRDVCKLLPLACLRADQTVCMQAADKPE